MSHSPFFINILIWIDIATCITQSAFFSGLNLAIFSLSKLRLKVQASVGDRDAIELLALRKDSNLADVRLRGCKINYSTAAPTQF